MAYVKAMENADGEVTSYRVRWRKGGARDGLGESERFDGDEVGREAAELFCAAVNDAGQDWPPGWVKGKGMIVPDAADDSEYRFDRYAAESVNHRTGVEDRYRDACHGELARYINPTFGNCDVHAGKNQVLPGFRGSATGYLRADGQDIYEDGSAGRKTTSPGMG
ncbi:hypothetical protein ACWCPM_28130 [Streptomyces sp. NPDC002309]